MSKIKKGYKQTEIGMIPEDWEVRKLNDAAISVASGKSKTENEIGDCPIYGSTGIIGYRKESDYSGDKILIARVGANAGTINRVNGQYCVSDNTLMVSYQSNIDIDFSYYQLVHFDLNKLVFGSGQPLITGGQVKKILLAFPKSKPEQKAIAEVLSDTDALIEKLAQLIVKKKNLKQATMQQLLTGKKRLAGFSGEWEVKRLGDIFRVTRGQVLSMTETNQDRMGEYQYPVYSSQTKDNGLAGYYTNYLFEDCITWTTDGANAGDVKYRSGKFYCTNVCGVLESKEGYANGCIAAIFNSVSKKYVSYVGNPKLMNNVVSNIEVFIPPTIEEQKAIATILFDMDAEIEVLEKERAKYQAIKQGMMQSLLTGQIRLLTH